MTLGDASSLAQKPHRNDSVVPASLKKSLNKNYNGTDSFYKDFWPQLHKPISHSFIRAAASVWMLQEHQIILLCKIVYFFFKTIHENESLKDVDYIHI